MIELKGITHHYGIHPVLREIDVTIDTGGITAIVGPNGMGKTTLLAIMAGAISPLTGSVCIDGLRRRGTVDEELEIRRRIAYLPDRPWLPKNRTGREFLFGVGKLYAVDDDRLFDHRERLLRLFQLEREGDWPLQNLSHGQKKKIALASILITECNTLLLDEPFGGGLDPAGIVALQEVLRRLGQTPPRTIVMTAPDPSLIESMADRVVVLRDGRVAAFDTLGGLRQLAAGASSLTEAISRLTVPDARDAIDDYFKRGAS